MTFRELHRRVRFLFQRDRFAEDLREEMRLHIELRARKLTGRGMDSRDAAFAARRSFGNRGTYEDRSSEIWGWMMWERILQDLRMGVRTLFKTPGFTAVAILTLAIGLGMNTAIYSLVNAVMLRNLSYTQPDRLVALWEAFPPKRDTFNSSGSIFGGSKARDGLKRTTVAVANIADYEKSTAFQRMASYDFAGMNLTGNGLPERINGDAVSSGFFSVLGVTPMLGRDFRPEDDNPEAAPTVMLTHGFWQRRLGSDTEVLSRTLTLDGRKYQVIGVLPRDFQAPSELAGAGAREFFVPAAYPKDLLVSRGDHEVNMVARLRPGVTVSAAQADLKVIQSRLAKEFPTTNKDIHPQIALLKDDLVQGAGTALWSLLGASVLLVLITCVNVANLLLVRATGRRREMSVRMAIGAGRARLMRQFVTESLLLAAFGCAAGIGMGLAIMRTLVAAAPKGIPRLQSTSMDWTVFGFAAAIATLTGLIFGILPAWHATRVNAGDSLKTSARSSAGKGQVRWLGSLTVVEVGLSLMLLIGAGLMLRSFAHVMGVDLGFQPDRVLAMNINLPDSHYAKPEQRLQFYQTLEQRVRALPGVQSVAYANRLPMRGGWRSGFTLEAGSPATVTADFQAVNPGYFETLGIPLVHGRLLTEHDSEGEPYVAIANKAFGRAFLNGADPKDRTFVYAGGKQVTIVGVVGDIRRGGKEAAVLPEVYLPAAQIKLYPTRLADFAVRVSGDPVKLTNAVRQEVLAIDKDQPILGVRTLREVIDLSVAERRFEMLLLAVFAAVAVVLAIVGIYGVLSYSMAQRTGELGIRVALGAHPSGIVALVMGQAGKLIAGGLMIGAIGALVLTRYLQTLLFEIGTKDVMTYAIAPAVLGIAGVLAALVPAMRSARVDPMVALRNE